MAAHQIYTVRTREHDRLVPWSLDLLSAKLADELVESTVETNSGQPIAAVFSSSFSTNGFRTARCT